MTARTRLAAHVGTAVWHVGYNVAQVGRLLEKLGDATIDAGDALAARIAGERPESGGRPPRPGLRLEEPHGPAEPPERGSWLAGLEESRARHPSVTRHRYINDGSGRPEPRYLRAVWPPERGHGASEGDASL